MCPGVSITSQFAFLDLNVLSIGCASKGCLLPQNIWRYKGYFALFATFSTDCSFINTGTPYFSCTYLAPPVWSSCACVISTLSTSTVSKKGLNSRSNVSAPLSINTPSTSKQCTFSSTLEKATLPLIARTPFFSLS